MRAGGWWWGGEMSYDWIIGTGACEDLVAQQMAAAPGWVRAMGNLVRWPS